MPTYNEDMIITLCVGSPNKLHDVVRPVNVHMLCCRNSPLGARYRSGGNPCVGIPAWRRNKPWFDWKRLTAVL